MKYKYNYNNVVVKTQPVKSIWLQGCDSKYTDYYNLTYEEIISQINIPVSQRAGPRGGVRIPFPIKLYQLLEEVEENGNGYIISWSSHGRSFIIHLPELFIKTIIPKYFDHSKYASFQRQLNLYGFKTIKCGPDEAGQYHPLFLRGRTDILDLIIRKTTSSEKNNSKTIATNLLVEERPYKCRRSTSPPSSQLLLTFANLPICMSKSMNDDDYDKVDDTIQTEKAPFPSSSVLLFDNSTIMKNKDEDVNCYYNSTVKSQGDHNHALASSIEQINFQLPLTDAFEPRSFANGMNGARLNLLSNNDNWSNNDNNNMTKYYYCAPPQHHHHCRIIDPSIQKELLDIFLQEETDEFSECTFRETVKHYYCWKTTCDN